MSGGVQYDEREVMATLEHMCHWPSESDKHSFIEWIEGLNTLELVAVVFFLLPIVGTLVCMANSIFKWNTGCCRACCGNRSGRYNRLTVAPVITAKTTVLASSLATGRNF
jgi:hypothetical protein